MVWHSSMTLEVVLNGDYKNLKEYGIVNDGEGLFLSHFLVNPTVFSFEVKGRITTLLSTCKLPAHQ